LPFVPVFCYSYSMKDPYRKVLRQIIGRKKPLPPVSRLKTGIKPLDEMLSGGLPAGLNIVAGGISSGKTIVSLNLIAGAKDPLIISFDEGEAEIKTVLKHYAPGLENNALIIALPRALAVFSEIFLGIAKFIGKGRGRTILINSMSSTGDIRSDGRKEFYDALQALMKFTGSRAVLVYETEKEMCVPSGPMPSDYLFELAETVNFLNYAQAGGEPVRYSLLVKNRGGKETGASVMFQIRDKNVRFTRPKRAVPPAAGDNITVKAGLSTSDIKIDSLLVSGFSKMHPGIKLELAGPGKGLSNKTVLQEGYDVLVSHLNEVRRSAEAGLIQPMANYFYEDIMQNVYPSVTRELDYGSNIYCVPSDVNVYCLTYRKDLFNKYGIKKPVTFNDLVDSVKFVVKKEKIAETGLLYRQSGDDLVRVLVSHALSLAENMTDPVKDAFNIDEKYEKALSFMRDCMYKHGIVKNTVGKDPGDPQILFLSGKSVCFFGMGYAFISSKMRREKAYSGVYGMTNFPSRKNGPGPYNPVIISVYVIPSSSSNALYASEAIKFISSEKMMMMVRELGNYPTVTTRRDVNAALEKAYPFFDGCRDIMDHSICLDSLFKQSKFRDILRNMASEALSNRDADPARLVKEAAGKAALWRKTKYYEDSVEKARLFMEKNYSMKISVGDVSSHVNLSPRYFEKIFKAAEGVTVGEYIEKIKMENAKTLLVNFRHMNIKQVAEKCGFTDPAYFTNVFKKYHRMTPVGYRQKTIQ
jgi:AraC-like DNA-binding protein